MMGNASIARPASTLARMSTVEPVEPVGPPEADDPFSVVRRVRSFDDVVIQVQEAIHSGRFRTGDKLPSERDLCQRFGVGRPTVREALRVLEALGVVDIRPGKTGGIFVAEQTGKGVGAALASLLHMVGATPEELGEFRASFEGETAAWAAQRAHPEEVERLQAFAAEAHAVAALEHGRWRDMVRLDIGFHQLVAQASRNRVRVAVMQGLLQALERTELTITSLAEPYLLGSTAKDLTAVADAIRDGDPECAREAMRSHVEFFSELYVRAAASTEQRAGQSSPPRPRR